ncbi:SepM family pheromone-processing serine protease [Brevibacillus sp. TJ4]|uniref:SepM family pheromone-processing serine protease n=1 Tax=Brevibacillus sp. TJ4 TaxID=3234853 RepID=UPI0037D15135
MSENHLFAHSSRRRGSGAFRWPLFLIVFLLGFSLFVPTNYYVTRPGSAIELGPIIDVEGGTKSKAGSFMLTTVRMGEANLAWYLYAQLSPDAELLPRQQVVSEGEDNEDFVRREQAAMDNSQKTAEAVAFRMAGYDVEIEKQGVWVMGTIEGLPAKGVLRVGDVITAVDGVPTMEASVLQGMLAEKRAGDEVEITYKRGGEETTAVLSLGQLPGSQTPGIGIRTDTKQNIIIPQDVTITSNGIGGPSAGLMMTLEIYDQLQTDINLTKGYRVAGTGTISLEGTVGRIGGIHQKIVAAHNAGAEIFFAPDDLPGDERSNYREALATAERIGTAMKVVPVHTIEDAIAYLREQTEKHS